jgi:LAS superfamily LD-carboxypeptidase LdcB
MNGLELNHARTRKEIYNIQNFKPEKKVVHYDLYTDSSIVKYVSNKVSFDNLEYVPDNLVELSSEYVFDKKKNDQLLRKVANDNLQILGREFYLEFERKLEVVSAYRSYAYQK